LKEPFYWLGEDNPSVPLILTVPHSGEEVPPEATWLTGLEPALLLTDVDRFVHELYEPATRALKLPALVTRVHRYAADLNRFPGDVDSDAVEGAIEPSGKFPKGFHWVVTTRGERLMDKPVSRTVHDELVRLYHDRFHQELASRLKGRARTYHLDCHSMPSVGTGAHRDGGQKRADVVISDLQGKSATPAYKDLVVGAFRAQGFEVAYNWPYFGGRITERYGQPAQGHETIQIELNRALYMDERTYEKGAEFDSVSRRLTDALREIATGLKRAD